jgi:hypothetical protein
MSADLSTIVVRLDEIRALLVDALDAPPAPRLLTANQLADRLGVSADFIYEHADALGARRLPGSGRQALRFSWPDVEAAIASQAKSESPPAPRPRARSRPRSPAGPTTGPSALIRAPRSGDR